MASQGVPSSGGFWNASHETQEKDGSSYGCLEDG
jgi:hypothetical protein